MSETDPNGKDAHAPGAKLDNGKPELCRGLLQQFPRACAAVAHVTAAGAAKYTWGGWQHVPDGVTRYNNAMCRHIAAVPIEGEYDREGFLHRAQVAWNSLAALELWLREREHDARGKDQGAGEAAPPGA